MIWRLKREARSGDCVRFRCHIGGDIQPIYGRPQRHVRDQTPTHLEWAPPHEAQCTLKSSAVLMSQIITRSLDGSSVVLCITARGQMERNGRCPARCVE